MTGSKPKRRKYLVDGVEHGRYVRAWKEGRSEIVVEVWAGDNMEGEAGHEWVMPAFLGLDACVHQAVLQSPQPTSTEVEQ